MTSHTLAHTNFLSITIVSHTSAEQCILRSYDIYILSHCKGIWTTLRVRHDLSSQKVMSDFYSAFFIGFRTTPHWIKTKPNYCPPGPRSLWPLPTRITSHQDHYQPVKPLIWTNTCTLGNIVLIIIIIINHACIAHITFREKSLCALRMKNTEGSKVKMGQVSKQWQIKIKLTQ